MKRAGIYLLLLLSLSQCHQEIPVEPLAAFSVQNNNCLAPCEVTFLNESKNATSFLWDFDDGQTSTEANPRHAYKEAGSRNVRLTATGEGGRSGVTQAIQARLNPGVRQWDYAFGGSGEDKPFAAIATPDGGFLLGGPSLSDQSGNRSKPSQGGDDYWVVKTDANGTLQWEQSFGGAGDDVLDSAVPTPDGGYLLAGYSNSGPSGDKSEGSRGGDDYWVVKIDASGKKVWDKTLGGSGGDYVNWVETTSDGFLVAGYSDSGQSGDKSEKSRGGFDYWVVKIDASGKKVWDRTFGGGGFDGLRAVSSDGLLLVGYSNSRLSGDFTQAFGEKAEYWVVKIDANGTKQWDKSYGGNGEDYLNTVIPSSDGGYLLVGSSDSDQSGNKTQASKGGFDYWVVKIEADGRKVWDKTFGGNGTDLLTAIAPSPGGGFLLAGISSSGPSGDKSQPSQGGLDYWALMIDANGTPEWDKTYGTGEPDYLTAALASTNGSFLLAGYTNAGKSGDKSQTSQGASDHWVLKIK